MGPPASNGPKGFPIRKNFLGKKPSITHSKPRPFTTSMDPKETRKPLNSHNLRRDPNASSSGTKPSSCSQNTPAPINTHKCRRPASLKNSPIISDFRGKQDACIPTAAIPTLSVPEKERMDQAP
ncbi:hypothetical protein PIB30_086051 [Stylosanthes scabra]|uniref:Uncharacterized protein n=1 Tax=Stylosanthes scabra TaxID=79078 RepID=A0ABU6QTJ0_9FABA|nr:hypothetical protein [Stylosanthes scabra]